MKLQEFFNKCNGQKIDTDGLHGAQCTDLINQYRADCLGTPSFGIQYAKDIYSKGQTQYYDKVSNTPDAVPQAGDIIVWNGNVASGVGHVAIASGKGDTNSFESFDQNWPTGSACHFVTHNYTNVTGWLRPKTLDRSVEAPKPEVKIEYVDRPETINELNTLKANLQRVTDLYNESQAKINTLNELIDINNKANSDEVKSLQIRINELTKSLQLSEKSLQISESEKAELKGIEMSWNENKETYFKTVDKLEKALKEARVLTEQQKREIVIEYIKEFFKKLLKRK